MSRRKDRQQAYYHCLRDECQCEFFLEEPQPVLCPKCNSHYVLWVNYSSRFAEKVETEIAMELNRNRKERNERQGSTR